MKVAVTTAEPGLDVAVEERFGRAPYFMIVETDDMSFEAVENPAAEAAGGAGPQAAQAVAELGATAVLTGNCGPKAHRTLQGAGVKTIVGVTGTVREAVERFLAGEYEEATEPNVSGHFGMGQ
ncbi:MAG: NifB/NifX family molybdenum-iron cluster-binding protein [Candidatus Zixiibacteriota bacterium]|jgi:predicted Fe-Mo cluster-binding NifX family protein